MNSDKHETTDRLVVFLGIRIRSLPKSFLGIEGKDDFTPEVILVVWQFQRHALWVAQRT